MSCTGASLKACLAAGFHAWESGQERAQGFHTPCSLPVSPDLCRYAFPFISKLEESIKQLEQLEDKQAAGSKGSKGGKGSKQQAKTATQQKAKADAYNAKGARISCYNVLHTLQQLLAPTLVQVRWMMALKGIGDRSMGMFSAC